MLKHKVDGVTHVLMSRRADAGVELLYMPVATHRALTAGGGNLAKVDALHTCMVWGGLRTGFAYPPLSLGVYSRYGLLSLLYWLAGHLRCEPYGDCDAISDAGPRRKGLLYRQDAGQTCIGSEGDPDLSEILILRSPARWSLLRPFPLRVEMALASDGLSPGDRVVGEFGMFDCLKFFAECVELLRQEG